MSGDIRLVFLHPSSSLHTESDRVWKRKRQILGFSLRFSPVLLHCGEQEAGCLRSAPPLPIINDFTRSTPHLRYAFDCVFRCENPLKLVCELAKPQLWLDAVQAGTWDVEREKRCRFRFFRYARSRTCPSTLHKTSLSSYELVWLHFPTSWRPQHSVLGRMRCFPFTCPVCSVVSLSQQHDDWYYVTSFYVSVHELQLCKAFLSAGLCSHSVSLSL